MNKREWEIKQEEKGEIESNQNLFEDIKIGLQKDSDLFFEYVVNRLFLALGNYDSIVYEMKLDEKNGTKLSLLSILCTGNWRRGQSELF